MYVVLHLHFEVSDINFLFYYCKFTGVRVLHTQREKVSKPVTQFSSVQLAEINSSVPKTHFECVKTKTASEYPVLTLYSKRTQSRGEDVVSAALISSHPQVALITWSVSLQRRALIKGRHTHARDPQESAKSRKTWPQTRGAESDPANQTPQ